ncbi:MAG: F0F1 ATP synthase subunit A [Acidobacteriota bacterium]|nr:F0F1 ATP synthase subunit A [Acidobacteriota bacterium]MDQ3419036.1 F0F1 ATP synthase subunit A [Acidobacteriota bacterium]
MAASAIEHPLLIVDAVNSVLGPVVVKAGEAVGYHFHDTHAPIPNFMVMIGIITLVITGVGLLIRSRLSVENPGKFQIILEDGVRAVVGLLEEWIGPSGARFLPLIATLGLFILMGNYMGLVPGLMAPTSSINTTLGCAITIWVYYHYQGFKAQGIGAYLKHFAAPPGAPIWMAPIMLPIELISHFSRVMSLSLRLFGNVFGEELVIAILFGIIPFLVPLPMMMLGLITGGLQAFIFMLLSIIYLQGAVAVEHHHDEHGHDAPHGHQAPAAA